MRAWLAVILVSIAASAAPQKKTPPPEKFTLLSVTVEGSTRYQSSDILAQIDLKPGQTCDEGDFRLATQRLGDTGLFTEVSYSYDYSPEGTKLRFLVKDATDLVPVTFDNLIWFSDEELQAALHTRVPLFTGELPARGDLAQQVSDALQNLLVEKKIPGEADFIKEGEEDGPVRAISFRVSGPRIHLQQLTFPGADPQESTALKNASAVILGLTYSRSTLLAQAKKTLLPVFLAEGYLKADFGEISARILQQSENEISVEADLPVNRGTQFRLEGYQVEGSKVFTQDKVEKVLRLQPQIGKPVDLPLLEQNLAAVRQLCGRSGYIGAEVKANPAFSGDSVRYAITIHEGPVYAMGELDIQGLEENLTNRLRDAWTLQAGKPYDAGYPQVFLEQASNDIPVLQHFKADFVETPNDKQKTVDVTLRFLPPSR